MRSLKFKIQSAVLTIVIAAFLFSGKSFSQDTLSSWLKNKVSDICNSESPRNIAHLNSLNKTGENILDELRRCGFAARKQNYKADSLDVFNVIAQYGDTMNNRIVLGAHYDVCGDQPGADDNASGVAGLLAIAHFLQKEQPNLKHGIELVFYTLEEPPYFRTDRMGSYIHAKSLSENKTKIELMISIEMIGFYSEEKKSQRFPMKFLKMFYPTTADFIAVVGKGGMRAQARQIKKLLRQGGVKVEKMIAPSFVKGIDFSDHMNYWLMGFKAIMITDTAFMRNPHYHRKSDKPETLNYVKMAEVVKAIYHTLQSYK